MAGYRRPPRAVLRHRIFLVGHRTFHVLAASRSIPSPAFPIAEPFRFNLFAVPPIKSGVHKQSTSGDVILFDQRDVSRADAEAADAALAASGDAAAFERLYRAHVARVYSLARRMTGAEEADELTQDVFVRTWEKLDTFRGDAAFGTWLHRLAVNVILGKRAVMGRDRKRLRGDESMEHLRSRTETPDLSVDFEAAIERLPEGAKQVFVLHDVEGYKHKEIAEMLGVTDGTSKAQLHRARMALRQYVER